MSCDWAERVSALVDGELDADESRAAEEHLSVCAACRDAAQSYRALRREIISYAPPVDTAAQSRVLSAVLSSKNGRSVGATRRRETRDTRARLAALFGGRGLAPAMSAAAALLLVAAALGLLVYLNTRRATTNVNLTARDAAPPAQQNDPRPETTPTTTDKRRREGVADNIEGRPEPRREVATGRKPPRRVLVSRGPRRRATDAAAPREVVERVRPQENGRPGVAPPPVVAVASSVPVVAAKARDTESVGALSAARHAEQAQMLLRSFRNARLADGGVADERARSKKLLYRNIVLRREAATRRDATVAQALDRLEPILLDIANLPDDPAEEEVNSIRERMRKQNLVVMLQASAASRKRSY